MMQVLYLYWLFLKISLFTFGGGYAMIPLFQDELVSKGHFLDEAAFANMVALAQVTPGPVGLNAATYIGYNQAGVLGAIAGTLGVITPSLILTLLAAIFIVKMKNNIIMKDVLEGVRPVVLGLIAAAVIFFAETSVFTGQINNLWRANASFGVCIVGICIFALSLILQKTIKINMIVLLILSALLSFLLLR